jgi:hypothetical protein
LSDLEEPECSCKEYIQTNYQNLVDYLLEPILNMDASDKTKMILSPALTAFNDPRFSQGFFCPLFVCAFPP